MAGVWNFFPVDVGARSYCCPKFILCSFEKLGFNKTLITNTIKRLSKSFMVCSSCIWLVRNNKE